MLNAGELPRGATTCNVDPWQSTLGEHYIVIAEGRHLLPPRGPSRTPRRPRQAANRRGETARFPHGSRRSSRGLVLRWGAGGGGVQRVLLANRAGGFISSRLISPLVIAERIAAGPLVQSALLVAVPFRVRKHFDGCDCILAPSPPPPSVMLAHKRRGDRGSMSAEPPCPLRGGRARSHEPVPRGDASRGIITIWDTGRR